jgi:Pentapeptide repeats (8 copies)
MQLRRVFWTIGRAVAIMVFAACVILVLWWVPKRQVASLQNAKGVDAKDVFKAENDARATLAQILGGFTVLIGVYFAWKNIKTTVENLELTNRNLELTKEGQVTERFYKAIEQLGATNDKRNPRNPKFELRRLGGVYALERIARDSEKDHWPIMEVLTAYVRENSAYVRDNEKEPRRTNLLAHGLYPNPINLHPLATDIQAILTVIRRRERSYEKSGQNLDLHGADLHGADLQGANLQDAYLESANLRDAKLQGANLRGANLQFAVLKDAVLNAARPCPITNLEGAHLERAELQGANLEGANLKRANLQYAYLESANLRDAELQGANLDSTSLSTTHNLTQEQINSATGDENTGLPPGIVMPDSWNKGP